MGLYSRFKKKGDGFAGVVNYEPAPTLPTPTHTAIHRSAGRERRSVFPSVDALDEGIQLKNILRQVDGKLAEVWVRK